MLKKISIILIVLLIHPFCFAEDVFTDEQEDQFVKKYSQKYNIPENYMKDVLEQATFQSYSYASQLYVPGNKKVKPKSFARYRSQFLNPTTISQGVEFYCQNQKVLVKAQKKYGVPPAVILGIIGVETRYGSYTGNIRVLDALATIAFNAPRRVEFFQDELAKYILICYKNKLDPKELRGAVDGGFGLSQFMPSAYLDYAVSASGDDVVDLMQPEDAIMSTANYLKGYGWQPDDPVVYLVRRNPQTCRTLECNQKEVNYSIATWRKYGVQLKAQLNPQDKANLFTLQDAYSNVAWLGLNNFFTIYAYNHSYKYALVVYQLGNAVIREANDSGC